MRSSSAILFSILLFGLSSAALATTQTWRGPYVGAYFGAGFGIGVVSTNVGTVTDTSYFQNVGDINLVTNAGASVQNPITGLIGVEAGHDWVWRQMVYGFVTDYGAFIFDSSRGQSGNYPSSPNAYSINTSIDTNWLFTLRARLGYALPLHWPTLLYFTGGMAITQLQVSNNFSDNAPLEGAGGSSIAQDQIGWAAGLGIEVATIHQLFVNFEYLCVSFPTLTNFSSISNSQAGFGIPLQSLTSPFSTTVNFHANLLKVGLSYRFDE